jgi:hypothetical protein
MPGKIARASDSSRKFSTTQQAMDMQIIQQKIYEIRGVRVMLDADLAELYGVETKRLKEAVRRNIERFPADFMFELSRAEYNSLRSQFASLEKGRGKYSKFLPFAFTEHGVAMLSGVLNSPRAIETNIAIIRAFIALRHFAGAYAELSQKITELETRYDSEIADIHEALTQLAPPDKDPDAWENRPRIGFKS